LRGGGAYFPAAQIVQEETPEEDAYLPTAHEIHATRVE
jgi:hypothetical protein